MAFRTVAIGLIALLLSGCRAGKQSEKGETSSRTPATQPQPAKGLEGIRRVRLQVEVSGDQTDEMRQALQDQATKLLHEQLPLLRTDGTAEDWQLEMSLGWQHEYLPHIASGMPRLRIAYHVRLTKPIVLDGREATAVAYAGPEHPPRGEIMRGLGELGNLRTAVDRVILAFVADWKAANPEPNQQ